MKKNNEINEYKHINNIKEYVENKKENANIFKARKKVLIQARQGVIGEKINTIMKDGHVETQNTVSKDKSTGMPDWIITNPNGEQYIVKDSIFKNKYEHLENDTYKSKGDILSFMKLEENLSFTAPWGEEMYIKNEGVLNISNLDDIYGIQKEEFEQTYDIINISNEILNNTNTALIVNNCKSKIFYDASIDKDLNFTKINDIDYVTDTIIFYLNKEIENNNYNIEDVTKEDFTNKVKEISDNVIEGVKKVKDLYKIHVSNKTLIIPEGRGSIEKEDVLPFKDMFDKISFPKSLTKIGEYAFSDCDIKFINMIKTNIKEIDNHAFSNSNIEEIWLPRDLEKIHPTAFEKCSNNLSVRTGKIPEFKNISEIYICTHKKETYEYDCSDYTEKYYYTREYKNGNFKLKAELNYWYKNIEDKYESNKEFTIEDIKQKLEDVKNAFGCEDYFAELYFEELPIKKEFEKINQPEKTQVLWFSRHEMTKEQKDALGDNIEIKQIDKTINNAYEIKDEIDEADIIAVVAPINLQKQFIDIAGDKPVITALNNRVLIPQPDGMESKVEFQFNKWEQIKEIKIEKEDFDINNYKAQGKIKEERYTDKFYNYNNELSWGDRG